MEWSINEQFIMDDDVEGERTHPDGTVYEMRKRPTTEEIKQMQFIKQRRNTQKLEEQAKPKHPLSNDFKTITTKRGNNRETLLREIAYKFCELHKERGMVVLTMNDINDLCECITSKDTRKRLRRLLIKLLVKDGKIEKRKYNKSYHYYQLKPLVTYDGESWAVCKNKKAVVCGSNISIARSKWVKPVVVYDLI